MESDPAAWFKSAAATEVDVGRVEELLVMRTAARDSKDFAEADRIRDELAAMGVVIEDGPDGPQWRLAVADQ